MTERGPGLWPPLPGRTQRPCNADAGPGRLRTRPALRVCARVPVRMCCPWGRLTHGPTAGRRIPNSLGCTRRTFGCEQLSLAGRERRARGETRWVEKRPDAPWQGRKRSGPARRSPFLSQRPEWPCVLSESVFTSRLRPGAAPDTRSGTPGHVGVVFILRSASRTRPTERQACAFRPSPR